MNHRTTLGAPAVRQPQPDGRAVRLAARAGLTGALLAVCLAPPSAFSVEAPTLRLRSVSVEAAAKSPAVAPGIIIVQGLGPADTLRQGLQAVGAEVLRYLPDRAWLVRVDGSALDALTARSGALGVARLLPYLPEWKIAPEVFDEADAWVVHLMPGAGSEAAATALRDAGATVTEAVGPWGARLGVQLPAGQGAALARALATRDDVFWIEARGEVRLLNDRAVPLLQSGSSRGPESLHRAGLRGEGQLVGYIDTGLDFDSCYFRDDSGAQVATNGPQGRGIDTSPEHRKVHAYDFLWLGDSNQSKGDFDNHGHGTHVGGNIGGAALAADPATYNGMAPEARFVVQDGGYSGTDNCADLPGLGCPVVDLIPFFEQAYQQGARVHTNSWGDNENSPTQWTYSAGSEDVDTVMWQHPDMLLIFAAGNSGPGAGTVGSPSTAKSVVSVGGSGNGPTAERVIGFSSRGPTDDGRIKPDVMAPASNTSAGSDRDITTDNCQTDSGAGTSYAAPLVAGAAALVRQYFTDGYYPTGVPIPNNSVTPSGALLKAMLVGSSVDMSRAAAMPSADQGFGRVQLDRVVRLGADASQLLAIDVPDAFSGSASAPWSVLVEVTDGAEPLDVSLVWTDYPSSPAAATHLVNDLDLTVSQGATTYRGNRMVGGQSVAGGAADRLNTVERVFLGSPAAGVYRITVTPEHIPQGAQGFALVVTGAQAR